MPTKRIEYSRTGRGRDRELCYWANESNARIREMAIELLLSLQDDDAPKAAVFVGGHRVRPLGNELLDARRRVYVETTT